MKSAAVALVTLAGAAMAQAPVLPDCAKGCANNFFSNGGYGNCGNDVACICADSSFISGIACCLAGSCNQADQTSAVSFAQQLCTGVGVSVPSAVSCTSTPSASSTGAAKTTDNSASVTPTGSSSTGAAAASAGTSSSHNYGPKQTPMAGLGAIGGLVAAVALL